MTTEKQGDGHVLGFDSEINEPDNKPKGEPPKVDYPSNPCENWSGCVEMAIGSHKPIYNYTTEKEETGKLTRIPKPIATILEEVRDSTGKWPRKASGLLFAIEGEEIQYFGKHTAFFGWLQSTCGHVHWQNSGPGFVTRQEFYEEWQRLADKYDAVERIPHEPRLSNHYYACNNFTPGDGSHLSELVGFFSPETAIDRELIRAFFVTPGWGGPSGSRPMFMVTAESGRGCGKSKLCHAVSEVYGGAIDILPSEKMEAVKTRLLSIEAIGRRLCFLDNVKKTRFTWGELEGLITSNVISGKKLYVGEGSRPNLLTWMITMNGVSLSTDLAQRVIEIRLVRPSYDSGWEGRVLGFIQENREAILADVIAFLQRSAQTITKPSRWATFDREVIGRLTDPDAIMEIIHSRRAECDSEGEEAGNIHDEFVAKLKWLGYDPDRDSVFIPSKVAAKWLATAIGDRTIKVTGASQKLKQLHKEGRLPELKPDKRDHSTSRRGFNWVGVKCLDSTPIWYDIDERLESHSPQNNQGTDLGSVF